MWYLAISSINITHTLICYLYMNDYEVAPKLTEIRAKRAEFKTFCRLNNSNKETFFEIYAFGVRVLFKKWLKIVNDIGTSDIPKLMSKFQSCLESTRIEINALLGSQNMQNYENFKK